MAKQSNDRLEKIDHIWRPAGLARSHKIMKAEHDREIQFIKLCSQIRLDDFKELRSERQRNERSAKRKGIKKKTP